MSTVLVTGGLGFIGSHVVDLLVSEGFYVLVLDNDDSYSKTSLIRRYKGSIEFVRADIRDFSALSRFVSDADAVVHLAAIVNVEEFLMDPRSSFDVNVMGTVNVVEACRKNDVDKVVFASSTAVYGDPRYLPVDEEHPTYPRSPYGASKLAGEKILWSYSETYGLKTVSLRYFNVYGPRMRAGPYAGVIYKFIESVFSGKPITIFGDGSQTRDFVFVRDVAEATVKALEYNGSNVFNVGTGKSISILELANLIMELIGEKVDIVFSEERPGDIRQSRASIEKIKRELGWEPKVDLISGLKETIEYFRSKGF